MKPGTFRKWAVLILLGMGALSAPLEASSWTAPYDLKQETQAPAALIPFPRSVRWNKQALPCPLPATWEVMGKSMKSMPMVKTAWKAFLKEHPGTGAGAMQLKLRLADDVLPEQARAEGYKLSISGDKVLLEAASEAGLFYGIQTLRQLAAAGGGLPQCVIEDWPAFAWRGYMQDCGRNFRSVERLKKELDLAAQLKVNLFHWHLTDYPAWHIECKAYPQLNDPKHRTRDKEDTYTYEQIREVCEYAAARNIRVVPELDMPGHSAYFERAFGFKMHTEQGMKIVGELLAHCMGMRSCDCSFFVTKSTNCAALGIRTSSAPK